uniref:HlyC/CorC family transporter, hemolysin-like protein n=1 Tax=Apple proliferation phytoplasma TaxID=37692 RepID=A0A6B9D751_APPPP|nr:HlyC/CorC family transporter, hemolysin-like protein [Candidatus Phytoplasma mali]
MVLIIFNAIFAASEIALVSSSENAIDLDISLGFKKAIKVKKNKEKPTNFLSMIQIMIHILTFLQGNVVMKYFSDFKGFQLYIIEIIIIFVSIIFGELIPKRLAMNSPLKTTYIFVNLMNFISFLFTPLVWLLTKINNFILIILGFDPNKIVNSFSEDEIRLLLSSSYRKGIIDRNENEIIQNVFEFDNTSVSEVMHHRKEIAAVEIKCTKKELIQFIETQKYTRFPVYDESIDNIIGIIHIKDFFKYLIDNDEIDINESKKFSINNFMREAHYVLEFKKISELFREMKLKQNHMSIVIDEYGGTAGIVTIEDLIEEILGEISDEYDNKSVDIEKISDNEYIIKGFTSLYEVENIIQAGLPVDDYDTISGFMISQLKRWPKKNENVTIIFQGYQFQSLKYVNRVITKVKVIKISSIDEKDSVVSISDKN